MEGGDILHLNSDSLVAHHATICHRRALPWRSMTGFAISVCLRVRCDTAEHFPTLRIQGSRVIEQSALCIHIPANDEYCDDGSKDTAAGQTTQAILLLHIHSVTYFQAFRSVIYVMVL